MSAMFEGKLKQLRVFLKIEKIDAVFISSVAHIAYLTGYGNFSKEEREAYLIIGKDFEYIITDGRYSEAIKLKVPHFTLFERGQSQSTEELLKSLKKQIKLLGIEEDNLTVSEYKLIKKYFKTKDANLDHIRSIKTSEEIKKIKLACMLGDLAFKFILKKIKVGVAEKEIAILLENFIKQKGGEFSFPAIVAFGKNAAIPHHHTGGDKLSRKDGFVLLDFGVKIDGYCSDMTRTIFLGSPSGKQLEIYNTVLEAQKKSAEYLKAAIKKGEKVKSSNVDKAARDYIVSKGFKTIPHSVGHGIGLEVHEHPYISPKSEDLLKEGMVFSIEPGIYISGFGGVRIEDLYVLEENKLERITTSKNTLISI